MREYYLFFVKENIAVDFAGEERKIHSLLLDSFHDQLARKQVEFITHRIPIKIDDMLENALSTNDGYTFIHHTHQLNTENGQAKLQVSSNYIFLQSDGNIQVEAYFFEILRKWKKSFFALERQYGAYGWLTPIKKLEAENRL